MKATGNIIVLAYPDTFVTMSDEWICKFLPMVGLGTKEYIKAGHAALVLIENTTGKAKYFDFGRYVTPDGMGRVRGENSDVELAIPLLARLDNEGNLLNLEEFLLWLDVHPEKTHGSGRLIASICEGINYEKASQYIHNLQSRGSIRYGAFTKSGSNCSRFVTETILASTSERKIKKALKFNKKFTPSTVGNVEKAAAKKRVYEVLNGKVTHFKSTAFRENLRNYFDKKKPEITDGKSINIIPEAAQKLAGIGSSAWFEITDEDLPEQYFRIKRYNDLKMVDFDGVYFSEEFNPKFSYQFTYDSHCEYCHVIQNDKKIRLTNVGSFEVFSLSQKRHSVERKVSSL